MQSKTIHTNKLLNEKKKGEEEQVSLIPLAPQGSQREPAAPLDQEEPPAQRGVLGGQQAPPGGQEGQLAQQGGQEESAAPPEDQK